MGQAIAANESINGKDQATSVYIPLATCKFSLSALGVWSEVNETYDNSTADTNCLGCGGACQSQMSRVVGMM